MLPVEVIDRLRLGDRSTVSYRHLDHRFVPGNLHREPATRIPAGGVLDGIAAKLVGDAKDVIARRTFGQQRLQPPPNLRKLLSMPCEHPAPSAVWR